MGGIVHVAQRQLARRLSPRARKRIAAVLGPRFVARYRRLRTDVYLVSYPKCGRTWLRVMVGRAFQQHFSLPADVDVVELHRLAELDSRVPSVMATHDDDAQWKEPDAVEVDKSQYRDATVILLVRDPRDVIVSLYHQRRGRRGGYDGTLAEFLDEPAGGFPTLLRFYDVWASQLDAPRATLVVRYEDLHADPAGELRRVLAFTGVGDVSDEVISDAVRFGSFEHMRALEESGTVRSEKLRPGRPGDVSTYKTRRGLVGGYRDELAPDAVAHLAELMAASNVDRFGYRGGAGGC